MCNELVGFYVYPLGQLLCVISWCAFEDVMVYYELVGFCVLVGWVVYAMVCTLRLLLLTGSNFSDFAILFTFRVLILAILDFNHKTH